MLYFVKKKFFHRLLAVSLTGLTGLAAGLTALTGLAALLGCLAAGGLTALATHHVVTTSVATALALSTTMLAAGLAALATTSLCVGSRRSGHVGCYICGVHTVLHQVLKETTHHAVITTSVLAAVLAAATHVLTGVGHILYYSLRK